MIVRSGALVLTAEQCAVLAGVLGDGVRVRQARGERIGTEVHELLGEVETLARAWRATAASGSAAVPEHDIPDLAADDLSTQEAADRLGVKPRRVRQMIETGRLSGRKHGGSYAIPSAEVELYAARRASASRAAHG